MMKFVTIALLALPLLAVSCGARDNADSGSHTAARTEQKGKGMKIRLKVGDKSTTATLIDNPTTKEFVALLPLNVKMHDLFGREKAGPLPKALSTGGKPSDSYKVGEIGYWSPSRDVAIYYKQDGDTIPPPGIIMVGKLDGEGSKLFEGPDSVRVTIEREPDGS